MCSFGGHIVPRPHDKSLCYVGGDTRIIVVDRHFSLSDLTERLSKTLFNSKPSFTLKYQLPNEDLDSLISVTTDEDLDNMIDEYERLNNNSSAKSSRLRLFLFPSKPESLSSIGSLLENSAKSEDWFLNALNCTNSGGLSDSNSVNCLLGLDDDVIIGNNPNNLKGVGGSISKNQDVHSVPDSPMLETTSSFGSASSSPSLGNLPPIRVHAVEDQQQKVGIEEQFAQMGVGGNVNQKSDDGAFVVLSSAPPPTVLAAASGVPLSSAPGIGEYSNRIFSDDERTEQGGVSMGYRKQLLQQTQSVPSQLHQKPTGGGLDLASPDSVSSDGSITNPLSRQKAMIYQDPNVQIPSGHSRVSTNPVEPKITDLNEDEATTQHTAHILSGVKVLHGLDKVIEGGAVVLTLKDQSILANGDINEDVDMLENVEIGEQKQRDEAYKAAKRKTGIYVDKFSDDLGSEKKMLPQYDDPVADEGVTLDAAGHFSGEAEKKLEELRRRIDGVSATAHFEDLSSSGKTSSDYYTHEEMLRFKKPKKKKSLRKKDKLDLDALEAEALSAGLGNGDLGSRSDGKRQALKEEQEKYEAEKRSNAYQSAYARADEASKALRLEQSVTMLPMEEDDNPVFGDDDEDLRKSLERARKLALEKQFKGVASGPQAIALLASSSGKNSITDNENPVSGESQENKVVFTEMEEFVWGLQLDEEAHKPDGEDVFMEDDEAPKASVEEQKDEDGGWTDVQDIAKDETPSDENKEETSMDETIHEVAVGKGLSGALHLLKERGTLKESIEWGGRNMDKKKSKLVGIYENDGSKEIRIERTDEYGRILTPKEAFRLLSHKFHGKGPGKMKQEKRMRQYQEELKIKQMKNADTPSLSVERMRKAQAQLKTPYLVLSGNVKPGQTSDPRSGFATVEKDFPGGLTPMLGDRKVEHYLGIKRKSESGDMGPPKKPKT